MRASPCTTYRHTLWSKCVAVRVHGWWLMVTCPLHYTEHQHFPTLFTELMPINHIANSNYGHHIRSPPYRGHHSPCRGGGEKDVMLFKLQDRGKTLKIAHNEIRWIFTHLSGRWAFLDSRFCKTEHTKETNSPEIQRHTAVNSLSNVSGNLKVLAPCYSHRGGRDRRQSSNKKVGQWWQRQIRQEAREWFKPQNTLMNTLWHWFCVLLIRDRQHFWPSGYSHEEAMVRKFVSLLQYPGTGNDKLIPQSTEGGIRPMRQQNKNGFDTDDTRSHHIITSILKHRQVRKAIQRRELSRLCLLM